MENFKSVIEVINYFKDEAVCRTYLEKMRWNGKPVCPHCKYEKVYRFSDNKRFKCARCLKKFTVTVGSVFENTNVPLQKWLVALYLAINNKKGISSVQLSKYISVTQKTAWFMLQRIREMLKKKEQKQMTGIIEVDETYIGGKNRFRHWSKRKKGTQGRSGLDKIPMFGMLQRNGDVVSMKVEDTGSNTLQPIINDYIKQGSSVMSDEWNGYNGLNDSYDHKRVYHKHNQYVNGVCHTQNIEGFWAIVKRTIAGTYYTISKKHFDRYCKEFDFRYNTRTQSSEDRLVNAFLGFEGRLKYKQLIK